MPEYPASILLLCESESLASLDRRALREIGSNDIQVMTSGAEAASLLAGLSHSKDFHIPDLIVCTQKLADMDGEQFCAILRLHPHFLGKPILLLLPNDSEAEQLRALGCGASGLLGRPYTIAQLEQEIKRVTSERQDEAQLAKAARNASLKAFDSALANYGLLLKPERQPEEYFRLGMSCLHEKRWNSAIQTFSRALHGAQVKGEAELGIAIAWKGKNDLPRFKLWLGRATETFIRARQWHRARSAFARLLREHPDARNPFLAEANRLIKAGHYDQAANTLAQSLGVENAQQSSRRFAQICMAAPEPEKLLKALEEEINAVKENPGTICTEIKQAIIEFNQERKKREAQLAADRKWRIQQVRKESEGLKNADENDQALPPSEDSEEHLLTQNKFVEAPELSDPSNHTNQEINLQELPDEDDNETETIKPKLELMDESDSTSKLFRKKPRLNELLSVVKLTWNLARRSK